MLPEFLPGPFFGADSHPQYLVPFIELSVSDAESLTVAVIGLFVMSCGFLARHPTLKETTEKDFTVRRLFLPPGYLVAHGKVRACHRSPLASIWYRSAGHRADAGPDFVKY